MDLGFAIDLISDLDVKPSEDFNWEGKPTSLFCVVAGNVSNNFAVLERVLQNLGQNYRGVLYIDGFQENSVNLNYDKNVEILKNICAPLPNVVYLHNHVVILNSIAFVAANGWYGVDNESIDESIKSDFCQQDINYLEKTIDNLQSNNDAHRIIIVSGSLPSQTITFRDPTLKLDDPLGLIKCLRTDLKNKTSHWLFGSYKRNINFTSAGIKYCNNPKLHEPYHPQKILLG